MVDCGTHSGWVDCVGHLNHSFCQTFHCLSGEFLCTYVLNVCECVCVCMYISVHGYVVYSVCLCVYVCLYWCEWWVDC